MADGTSASPGGERSEVIIEFHAIGRAVKVSAIDPTTLTEVSIVAPSSATEGQMIDAVLKKIHYVLARHKGV